LALAASQFKYSRQEETMTTPPLTPAQLTDRRLLARAVEAAIWGMPIVSVDAMRQSFFKTGATYGDILYLSKPADWRLQITTPNASSLYVYFNYNLKDGPVVLEFPAAAGAGLFGSILDAWQVPIVDVGPHGRDRGKGAKYLLTPADFKDQAPAGHVRIRSVTNNGYAVFRAIPTTRSDEDVAKALELVKQLRLYPLAQAANPPQQRHIDIAGKLFDGIARFDASFYDSLARMVNEEPVQMRDMVAMGQLRSLGIEKGKEFKPDEATRTLLTTAIAEAQRLFMDASLQGTPYWPGGKWATPSFVGGGAKTAFTYQTESYLDVDERASMYFIACAVPKKLGAATYYLSEARDAANAPLDGAKSYRLHVPPRVPAKQFWAVTVYDPETAAFIRESPNVEVNSYQDLQKNADGSVDIVFGPKASAGKESNWIYTAPGKSWITFFRFYGPGKALFEKTWRLPDLEQIGAEEAEAAA
jgi:hypothetical protein